jgi:hypothetical protein
MHNAKVFWLASVFVFMTGIIIINFNLIDIKYKIKEINLILDRIERKI